MKDTLEFSTEQKQVSGIFYNNSHNGIIIYTEDTDDDKLFYLKFYNHLLDGTGVKVEDVIQLGNCDTVTQASVDDTDYSFPKLYVIDGDIYLTYKPKESKERLFVLDRYCIENYLLDEESICHAIQAYDPKSLDKIKASFDYGNLMNVFTNLMVPIYYYYSILSEENKKRKTTKTAGYQLKKLKDLYDFKSNSPKEDLINRFKEDWHKELLNLSGIDESYIQEKLDARKEKYPLTVDSLIKIVSGKDYIIPFFRSHAAKKFNFAEPKLASWKFNSAEYFDVSICTNLKQKILETYNTYKGGNKS